MLVSFKDYCFLICKDTMWIWYLFRAPKNFIKFPNNIHRHSLLSKDYILEHVGKLIVFFPRLKNQYESIRCYWKALLTF